ncbi:hypothetical protein SD80_012270 [Scytonema tolypothrichoides VB-61278]|nr:hypothetical protein SD80_012270 [Scytonema tolypothrichoides VB-61278]
MRSPFSQGAMVGAMCALAYITVYVLVFVTSSLMNAPSWNIVMAVILFYLFGGVIGVLPAMLLGGVTTIVLSKILSRSARRLTQRRAISVGVLLCLLGSLIVTILFTVLSRSLPWNDFGYLFYIGAPSIFYVLSGGWMGLMLYRKNYRNEMLG